MKEITVSHANMSVSAIVLAAGESIRMGEHNKLLLPLGEETIIEHVIKAITDSDAQESIVVVGHEANLIATTIQHFNAKIVINPYYQTGMGSSIRVGVEAANSSADGYMICLSDMPLITAGEYDTLIDVHRRLYETDQNGIVKPIYKGDQGNPVILSRAYRPAMRELAGKIGCRNIVKQNIHHVQYHEMQTDHVLRDIDTPEAYAKLLGSYTGTRYPKD